MDADPNFLHALGDLIALLDDDPFDWSTNYRHYSLSTRYEPLDWAFDIELFEDDGQTDGSFTIRPDRLDDVHITWSKWCEQQDIQDTSFDVEDFVELFYDHLIEMIDHECDDIQGMIDQRRGVQGQIAKHCPIDLFQD